MITKTQVKNIRLLHQKKYRDEAGLFIAEGPKIVRELLNSRFKVREIFAVKGNFSLELNVEEISARELESISALTTPNQVLAVFEANVSNPDLNAMKNELVLALDDIRDPGNLGTIIRIADWFGVRHILCSETSVDVFNPKVIQATMGSLARVEVYYVNLEMVLQGFSTIYAAVLEGDNIYKQKLGPRGVVVIGNESNGISGELMQHVTKRISIPSFSAGAESLNAAVATAVICSEFRRELGNI